MRGCPLGINIPGFIRSLREGDAGAALVKIREENWLPLICGRICTAPCEAACVLTEEGAPIGIRALERYAADFGKLRLSRQPAFVRQGKRIAVVGAGPAGLTAAAGLAAKGYQPTVFESLDKPGGILRYGIPEFRIPKKVLDTEMEHIKALGVGIQTNCHIGQTIGFDELFAKGFAAVLLATGAGIPKFMEIHGTSLGGVYYGEEFLMRLNFRKAALFTPQHLNFFLGQRVAVIGSGNTALDCARAALRLGRQVSLIFRGTEEDMRVRPEERAYGKQEGIHFESLVRPVEILGNEQDFVRGLKCVRLDFADTEATGDWQLIPVPDSEFVLDTETVIIAAGHQPNALVGNAEVRSLLKLNEDGTIWFDAQSGLTSMPKVFACGNVVSNAGAVVEAMASGKKAAEYIDHYLKDNP